MTRSINWTQVFGTNTCLWFVPLIKESGRPIGDGLTWPMKNVGNEITNSLPNPNPNNPPDTEMKNIVNANNFGSNFNYNSTSPMNPNH